MTITSLNIADGTVGKQCMPRLQKRYVFIIALVILVCLGVGVAFLAGAFKSSKSDELSPSNPEKHLPASGSRLHMFRRAAVCADGPPCAEIGRDILQQNGSAVDAAIAAMFCNGMVNMQSMGLGGGFLMTVYIKEKGRAYTLNARETAPLNSTKDMYKDRPLAAREGPLSVGVPGELRGYWAAHQKFGKLPWKDIVLPTIKLCEAGYLINHHQFNSFGLNAGVLKDPLLRSWFVDSDGNFKKVGTKVKPTKLCETLKIIAEKGADELYNGTLSRMLVEDLKEAGSIITAEDLRNYQAKWGEPVTVKLNSGDNFYSVPPPGSGVLLAFILKILDGYNFNEESINGINNTVLTYHRMIEAFKFAFARRTELGDPSFVNISGLLKNLTSPDYAEEVRRKIKDNSTSSDPKDYGAVFYNQYDNGTAHISVLAENGDAVSVTSSVNIYFGAGFTSKQTGIILNSGMDDFSFPYFNNYFNLPGSPNNKMEPGKRSLSSMTPSILTDSNGDVKMVIGASGGTKITTAVAQVIIRVLQFKQNIKEAVDFPRIHHQVFPMEVEYEYGTLQDEVAGLEALGHKTARFTGGSIICALVRLGEFIYANADHRKRGDVYGYN